MTKNTSVRRGLSVLAAACLAVGAAGVITMPAAHAATPNNAAEAAMVPTPLTRIVDSREAVGVAKAPENNEVLEIQVTGEVDTVSGSTKAKKVVVPAGAAAVVLNMTAVEAKSAGYFTAWENGQSRPSTSNINFMQGDIVANGAVVPLDSNGKISVFARGSADILLDIAGYYRADTYSAATPSRYFDSRLTEGGAVKARSITRVDVGDEGDLVTLNITADGAKAGGYITAWPTVEDATTVKTPSIAGMPQTSNLNYAEGQTVANTVQVVAGKEGYVSLFSLAETNLIVDKIKGIDKPVADCTTDDGTTALYCATVLSSPAERVMDTRVNLGSDKKTGYRNLNVLSLAGSSPDTLGSITLNVTVADAQADGFVAIGPNLEANGVSTSVLNYKAGQVMANRVTIPASYAGALQVYTHSATDVIVDVLGYTKTPSVSPAAAQVDAKAVKGAAVSDVDLKNGGTVVGTNDSIGGKSAIAIATADDVLADGFKLSGTTVTLKSPEDPTFSKEISLTDGATGYKMMKLDGLASGKYKAYVPLAADTANATSAKLDSYMAMFSFNVLGLDIATDENTVATTAIADAAVADATGYTVKVDGKNITATTTAATVANLVSVLNDALTAAEVDVTVTGSTGSPLVFTKKGSLPELADVAGGANPISGITGAGAVSTWTSTYDLMLDEPTNATGDVKYELAEATMVSAGQTVSVKTPTGFLQGTGATDNVVFSLSDGSSTKTITKTNDYGTGAITVTPPTRAEMKALWKKIPTELSVSVKSASSGTAPTDSGLSGSGTEAYTSSLKMKLKLG